MQNKSKHQIKLKNGTAKLTMAKNVKIEVNYEVKNAKQYGSIPANFRLEFDEIMLKNLHIHFM